MYLVKFLNGDIVEFFATDITDLMPLIVEYIGGNTDLYRKAMHGFLEDYNHETELIELYNSLCRNDEISKIYEIKECYEA